MSPVRKAFLALIIANLIWGAASPIFKLGLETVPPFTLAFWRFFIAAVLLGLFLGKRAKNPVQTRHDLWLLVGYAISGITLNIAFFFLGLMLTESINGPIIGSAQPIVTLFLSILFLRERFVWRKFIGMLAGTIGICIIVFEPLLLANAGTVLGNVLLVLAMLGAVGSNITGKIIFKKYDPIVITFWAFVISSASFIPLAFFEYLGKPTLYQTISSAGFFSIAYGAILSSLAAYCLFAYGISKIKASDASMFTYIDPVIGTILAWVILSEPVTRFFILGSIFIFTGIFMAEGRLHYHPIHLFWKKEE